MSKKDDALLELLKVNSRRSTKEIAQALGIPISTVYDRVKKLEEQGVIEGYRAVLNPKKLGKDVGAILSVTVNYFSRTGEKVSQRKLAERLAAIPCVEEVHIVAGGNDIILKVRMESVEELNRFVIDELRSIDGVDKTQTAIILDSVKDVY